MSRILLVLADHWPMTVRGSGGNLPRDATSVSGAPPLLLHALVRPAGKAGIVLNLAIFVTVSA